MRKVIAALFLFPPAFFAQSPAVTLAGDVSSTANYSAAVSGTFNNLAQNITQAFFEGGCTPANIAAIQTGGSQSSGGGYATDALTVCQIVPSTGTQYQNDVVGLYGQTNVATQAFVGYYGQFRAGADNAYVWGMNPVVSDWDISGTTHTGSILDGIEIDVNTRSTTTHGWAIMPNGNLGSNTNIAVLNIPKPASGQWCCGLTTGSGAIVNAGVELGALSTTGPSASQKIILHGLNSGGTDNYATIQADLNGNPTITSTQPTPLFTVNAVLLHSSVTAAGASTGDDVLPNNNWLRGANSLNNQTYRLMGLNSSNQVQIDADAQGVQTGGSLYVNGVLDANNIVSRGTQSISGCSLSNTKGGAQAGSFTSGTAGACMITITPGITAPNGWSCWANDLTTTTDHLYQTASTGTTANIAGTTALSDLVTWGCIAF